MMLTCDALNKFLLDRKVIENINNGEINIEGEYERNLDNEIDVFWMNDNFEFINYSNVNYFDIIHDGENKTFYSQLNASLMKLTKKMNI